ncbi:MAG TPA: threonine/serine dehydratase [Mycobacteriales bacterium]|nr:threonine/serine dehydratase [Mycobacteriales bacterium]
MSEPPTRAEITAVAALLEGHVRRTPILGVGGAGGHAGALTLKLEQLQVSGTFKARGAYATLLSQPVPPAGVVAASGGNFGVAVAYAAHDLGHHATVFVPESAPAAKADRLRALGADVVTVGDRYAQALAASLEHAATNGALFAHAYDQPLVVAGAGTCAAEIEEQVGDADTVLVAVGGGGLIGGVASWFRGDVRVVAVETERTPTLHAALAAGEPVDVEVGGLAASALGATRIGEIGFKAVRQWVEHGVLVTDDDVVQAQRWLWDDCRVVAEPGGATAMAALLSGGYRPATDERVVVLVCGANVDPGSVA